MSSPIDINIARQLRALSHISIWSFCLLPLLTGCRQSDSQSNSGFSESSEEPPAEVIQHRTETSADGAEVEQTEVRQSVDQQVNDQTKNDTNAGRRRLRLPDDRTPLNENRLRAVGLRLIRGKRLTLVTDVSASRTEGLCELADLLFDQLQEYFGVLPEAVDGSSFNVTGYLIGDSSPFASAGLMPGETLAFDHGRHVNYEFWMNDQNTDYYRRHLLLHEFTHCFMTCESGMIDIPPLWYIEGMAELFATHSLKNSGTATFGVLPNSFEGFEGWGRISELKRVFKIKPSRANEGVTPEVRPLKTVVSEVVSRQNDSDYAEWWAVCWLLQNHPDYRTTMEHLARLRGRDTFLQHTHKFLATQQAKLSVDWLLFCESIDAGYSPKHCFPIHTHITWNLGEQPEPKELTIHAGQGWQESGLQLVAGQSARISCRGQFSIGSPGELWLSEPAGVTVEYANGLPKGQVVGLLVDTEHGKISRRISIGNSTTLTAESNVGLWLQINDAEADRHDNSGTATVLVSLANPEQIPDPDPID